MSMDNHVLKWFEKEFGRSPQSGERIIGKFISTDVRYFAQEWAGTDLDDCVTKLSARVERKLDNPQIKHPTPYIIFALKGKQVLEINYNRKRDGGIPFSFEDCDRAIVARGVLAHCWVQSMEMEFRTPSFAKDIGFRAENVPITPGTEADRQARTEIPNQEVYRGLELTKVYNPITGATYNILDFNWLTVLHDYTDGALRPLIKKRLEDQREIDVVFGKTFG